MIHVLFVWFGHPWDELEASKVERMSDFGRAPSHSEGSNACIQPCIRFVRCWGFECISVCRHSTSQSHRIDNFHETSFQPILNFFGPFNQRLASIFRISDKIRPPAMWLFILGHARYQMTNKKDLTTTHVISYTPPSDDDDDDDNVDGLFGWRRRL